ncbi:MAG: hypothetical protein QMC67_10395 [Candidatus Wallbacteria bacterium]
MPEKNKDISHDIQDKASQLKDDNGNTIKTGSGPDFQRILTALGVCIALMILAKFFGM